MTRATKAKGMRYGGSSVAYINGLAAKVLKIRLKNTEKT
jgi:hypothetical protein